MGKEFHSHVLVKDAIEGVDGIQFVLSLDKVTALSEEVEPVKDVTVTPAEFINILPFSDVTKYVDKMVGGKTLEDVLRDTFPWFYKINFEPMFYQDVELKYSVSQEAVVVEGGEFNFFYSKTCERFEFVSDAEEYVKTLTGYYVDDSGMESPFD